MNIWKETFYSSLKRFAFYMRCGFLLTALTYLMVKMWLIEVLYK